jgi:hypothetical protein
MDQRKINFSTVFAGQNVGVKQVSEDIGLVTLVDRALPSKDPAVTDGASQGVLAPASASGLRQCVSNIV